MKPNETRTPSKQKHDLEHVNPTVIHDPEQDMYVLERWLRHAMENQTRFWTIIIAGVLALVAITVVTSGLSTGRGSTNAAWTRLESAKTAEEREEIATTYPKTPAGQAALLQVASEYYMRGFSSLPANKEVALPLLKKALDRFQRVADEAQADTIQARTAALGVARTLEARNELEKAVAQYEKVAGNPAWKGTPEAAEAARLAARLKRPEAAAFYKDLYAFKPTEATLPPGGGITLPGLPGGPNPLLVPPTAAGGSGSPLKLPDPMVIPPPPPTKAEAPAAKTIELAPAKPAQAEAPESSLPALPSEPFAPKPTKPAEIPADPFAPPGK